MGKTETLTPYLKSTSERGQEPSHHSTPSKRAKEQNTNAQDKKKNPCFYTIGSMKRQPAKEVSQSTRHILSCRSLSVPHDGQLGRRQGPFKHQAIHGTIRVPCFSMFSLFRGQSLRSSLARFGHGPVHLHLGVFLRTAACAAARAAQEHTRRR